MKIAVIGGGPAGMMAAISASECGAEVTLFEKNEKLGKKMYISGKGRCNLTNDCMPTEFVQNIATNPKFALNALYAFPPQSTINFCENAGLELKVERGNRVFPSSDKSSDVIKCFSKVLVKNNVKVVLNERITDILLQENGFLLSTITNIVSKSTSFIDESTQKRSSYSFDKVIIACGGKSYSATGSTGDGYSFAQKLGHEIVPLKSALCRILCKGTKSLEGISLKNVQVSFVGNEFFSEFGEMLFTDDGISGPCALTLSSLINKVEQVGKIVIDLKPALDLQTLDARILRDFSQSQNKDFCNSLTQLLPQRLIAEVVRQSGINPYKKVNQITSAERSNLVHTLKNLSFDFVGLDSIEHSIVTSGGVSVNQINPKTMESKIVTGLFFAGEVIDIDALTGGFNIQLALSTGFVAGKYAASDDLSKKK